MAQAAEAQGSWGGGPVGEYGQKHHPDARTPLQQGVVDSGHFGPPTDPFHEGLVDFRILKIKQMLQKGVGGSK